jgi:hypothetical protein
MQTATKVTKETIIATQREAFADASDAFELTPTIGTWFDLDRRIKAYLVAKTTPESELVYLLRPLHPDVWTSALADYRTL